MVRIDPKYRMPLVDMFVVIAIQRSSFQFSSFSDSQITSEQRAPLAAFAARLPVFIRERAPEFCKILAFYTWKRVYAVAVDAMLGQGIVSDGLVTMALSAQWLHSSWVSSTHQQHPWTGCQQGSLSLHPQILQIPYAMLYCL